jgi:hypothetical protein
LDTVIDILKQKWEHAFNYDETAEGSFHVGRGLRHVGSTLSLGAKGLVHGTGKAVKGAASGPSPFLLKPRPSPTACAMWGSRSRSRPRAWSMAPARPSQAEPTVCLHLTLPPSQV